MKKSHFNLSLIFLLLINACTVNRLMKYDENSECTTTVEGYYDHPNIWKLYYPALVLKKDKWIKYGKVIKEEEARIQFLEKKSGFFDSPDTITYYFEEILAIIDSIGRCTYGKIPERYSEKGISIIMHLKYLEEPEYKYINFQMEPNERFSYCVIPGTYKIDKIEFIHKDLLSESVSVPFDEFYVAKNTHNYLGNIQLALTTDEDSSLYKVPFEKIYDKSDAAMVGLAFGLIGALLYSLTERYDDGEKRYYGLKIFDDPEYEPIAGRILKKNLLH